MDIPNTSPRKMALENTFISAYPVATELEMMLQNRLGKNLWEFAPSSGNLREIVFSLIRHAKSEGWLEALLVAVIDDKPKNEKLRQFLLEQTLIDELVCLLEALDADGVSARKYVNGSLPDDCVYVFTPDKFPDIPSIVYEIWDRRDANDGSHATLWRLVRNIQHSSLSDSVKQQFRRWLQRVGEETDRIAPRFSPVTDIANDSERPALLIEISGQYCEKGRFHARAWLRNSGERPIQVFSTDGNETIPFTRQAFEDLFKMIIESPMLMGKRIGQIEVFLPIEALLFPIDQLTYEDDLGDKGKWVHLYPIVVRSQERALGIWRRKNIVQDNWNDKWRHIQRDLARLIEVHDINVSTQDLKNLLDGNAELACGCLVCEPKDPKKQIEILKRLIFSGVPVIFWFHNTIYEKCAATELTERVREELMARGMVYPRLREQKLCAIELLPTIVSEIRKSDAARRTDSHYHIGNNWALLWDSSDSQLLPTPSK